MLQALLNLSADVVELDGLRAGSREELVAWQHALAARDMRTVGAGTNAAAAAKPYTVDVRGTRVTLLGYTASSQGITATPEQPGTNAYDPVRLRADIIRARQRGADLVFVHLNYGDVYHTAPAADQQATFRSAVEAGADLVVGLQPFVSQMFELYQGRPIFYGLGPFSVPEGAPYGPRGLVLQVLVHRGRLLQVRPLVVAAGPEPRFLPPDEANAFLSTLNGFGGSAGR
ncbi:MAG: CapA family protein [Ardenticatenia bacterium]|nr:CapA family protein [Ardenticatenia bacterium]